MSNKNKIRKLEKRKFKLIRNIELCQESKKDIIQFVNELDQQYNNKLITKEDYKLHLNNSLKNKSPEEWIKYYNDSIKDYNYNLEVIEKSLLKEKELSKSRKATINRSIILFSVLLILVSSLLLLKPSLIGYTVYEPGELVNESITIELNEFISNSSIIRLTLDNQESIRNIKDLISLDLENATIGNNTVYGYNIGEIEINTSEFNLVAPELESSYNLTYQIIDIEEIILEGSILIEVEASSDTNETIEIISQENTSIQTGILKESLTQETAEINRPVSWIKSINLSEAKSNFMTLLPKEIFNITVNSINKDLTLKKVDEEKISIDESGGETKLIINERVEKIEIIYHTDPPESTEKQISKYKKEIKITSGISYEDVLTYTNIPEANKENIRLYKIKDTLEEVQIIGYRDKNNNSLIDEISWTSPSSNNQSYLVIIEITNAEHLDENKEFISNIYKYVNEKDNIWSEEIQDKDYVRVTFETNLTNKGDITIYPKVIEGDPRIEIYEFNKTEKIADLVNLKDEEYNKAYLTNLVGTQNKFDLRVIGGSIEIDHIIDPSAPFETGFVQTNGWATVNTKKSYTMPIVVVAPKEGYEISPNNEVATAVATNITSTSFKVQLYNESSSIPGNVSYIVVENGTHVLSNGMLLQAGRVEPITNYDANGESASSYYGVTFPTAYGENPVVIASPNNNSAGDWLAVRYDFGTLTTTGISLSLEVDQAQGSAPIVANPSNSIGWISINSTSATDMESSLESAVDEDPDTGDWRTLTFTNTYTTPLFFAIGEQNGGTDPTTVGIQNLGSTGVDIRRTEERTDGEQTHATEDTLWAVFESDLGNSPPTTPTNLNCNGGDCNISVDNSLEINSSGSIDPDGDNITYSIEASLLNTTTSNDAEPSQKIAIGEGGGTILGETGSQNTSGFNWVWVEFSNSYSTAPYIIATPITQNAGTADDDSALVPVIKDVNSTGFNFTICRDAGSSTCDTSAPDETAHWFAFDPSETYPDWIKVGLESAGTSGADTNFNFGHTFTNTPALFISANTYNDASNPNKIAAHAWADNSGTSTTGGQFLGCTHTGTADACTDTGTEDYAWVAIDLTNANFSSSLGFQSGSADISNSLWTAASFSPSYTSPRVMVTQNDDDGGQDPEYAWARSVTTNGMDFRYCEQDARDVCHSHTSELVYWFAMENGTISYGGAESSDTEATKEWENYLDTFSFDWSNISSLNITIDVSNYNNSGSVQNSNNNPDLQIELYNGSSFVHVGNFSISGTGNFTLPITDSTILQSWKESTNTDLRIRGVNFDYISSSITDEISWDGLWAHFDGTKWIEIGNHSINSTYVWNTTNIEEQNCINLRSRAIDSEGSNSYSDYLTKNSCLNISHAAGNTAPTIDSIDSISAQSITEASISTVTFSFLATDIDGVANLNDSSAQAYFNRTGETTRSNTTCSVQDFDSDTANYTCSIDLWYFDDAGDWTINVSVKDVNNEYVENSTTTFTLQETTAMVLSPNSLSWPTLSLLDINTLADNDPITLNNTGNKDISSGNVRITAYDLVGESLNIHSIPASDFTSHITDACDVGTQLVNSTSTAVSGATLPNGNFSDGTAQEDLYFCLEEIPVLITPQAYSSSQNWLIGII